MTNKPESAAVEAVAWRYRLNERGNRPWGPGPWGYETRKPTLTPSGLYDLEPLVPQSALDALRGEAERLRAIEAAAQAYFDGYCQDEASDEVDANGRGRWTGCPAYQIRDAAALREALTKESP